MDTAPPLFTGDKEITFPDKHDRQARVRIEQNLPLPMQVQMVISHLNVGDS